MLKSKFMHVENKELKSLQEFFPQKKNKDFKCQVPYVYNLTLAVCHTFQKVEIINKKVNDLLE